MLNETFWSLNLLRTSSAVILEETSRFNIRLIRSRPRIDIDSHGLLLKSVQQSLWTQKRHPESHLEMEVNRVVIRVVAHQHPKYQLSQNSFQKELQVPHMLGSLLHQTISDLLKCMHHMLASTKHVPTELCSAANTNHRFYSHNHKKHACKTLYRYGIYANHKTKHKNRGATV